MSTPYLYSIGPVTKRINRLFLRGLANDRISSKKITRLEADIELESETHKSRLINRNPRNLEQLSHDIKPEGFWLDRNPFTDWNRLIFKQKGQYLYATLVHRSGRTLIEASTKEPGLSKYFRSPTTVQATRILAQVVARRCLQSGYLTVGTDSTDGLEQKRLKLETFYEVVLESGLQLKEPPEIKPRSVTDV